MGYIYLSTKLGHDLDFPLKYFFIMGGIIALAVMFSIDGVITRTEGVIAILVYLVFMLYLVRDMWRTRAAKSEIEEAEKEVSEIIKEPPWHFPLLFVGGLIGLVIGALLVVQGVQAVLQWWRIGETTLGVTLLAIAANSVELVEAIIPAKKGLSEVVIGNVVGSSIFQLLFTLGIAALIRPLTVEPVARYFVIPAVAFCWLLLTVIAWQGKTARWVGIGLMALYLAFVSISIMQGLKLS
jgi:cation:H+ antiporter